MYSLPHGTPAQCDPDGDKPCCSHYRYGECGNTTAHCSCEDCTDYKRIKREWTESGGTQKWRHDGKCGEKYPLPDGTPGQCDPDGEYPCCNKNGQCSRDNLINCLNTKCIDYRVVAEIKKSGKNCTPTRLQSGFLKIACFDNNHNTIQFKCVIGDGFYEVNYKSSRSSSRFNGVTTICDNDLHFYQACGFNNKITNTDVFCGGYICKDTEGGKHKYINVGPKLVIKTQNEYRTSRNLRKL